MNLKLYINYYAHDGEWMYVNTINADGTVTRRKMSPCAEGDWTIDMEAEPTMSSYVDYFYMVMNGDIEIRREWEMITHRLEMVGDYSRYVSRDTWYDIPEDSYLYSSAYTKCIHRTASGLSPFEKCDKVLCLKVRAPQLHHDEVLMLTGDDEALGGWNPGKSVMMVQHEANEWVATIDASLLRKSVVEFKFIVSNADASTGSASDDIIWEEGDNRTLVIPEINDGEVVCVELSRPNIFCHSEKFAGTAIPVFSLRSRGSFGVGDFGDLKMMIDWVAKTGQRILQVLPINDTTLSHTWTDSYPYSCISIFALHPIYADLRQLPLLKDNDKAKEFLKEQMELNALTKLDYERVIKAKESYLRAIFGQEGKAMMATAEYKAWFKDEEKWLVPYAMFCVLRDTYGTADFSQWPDNNTWNEENRKALTNPRTKMGKAALFFYFVQYVLASQMKGAHEYARKNRVVLKGDIPIGVNRHGCDVWMEPRYFNLNGQTGAPPDEFSVDGQNWGFPTYNWDEMLKDDCQWWIRRFSNMSKYFDAYRIDHVLGFFRIWEIPIECETGLMGQFQPALGFTLDEIHNWGLQWTPVSCDMSHDTNVLFLPDHKKKGIWHPRICAQYTQVYADLSDDQKNAYNRLYDDYFYRRNTNFWYQEAKKKLPRLVNATQMLVCAEDLGMIPECVPWLMNELRILSLEIQSMPKAYNCRFGHISQNPYRSVCTISSHDTATMRMWWDEDEERTQDYYRTMLHRGDDAPHPMPGWLAQDIIYRHLACPSMLCILTLQDWLAINENLRLPDANEERINIPARPKHYWRYRMHLNLEDLLDAEDFNTLLKDMIYDTNRKG